jgi:hypothetical protein
MLPKLPTFVIFVAMSAFWILDFARLFFGPDLNFQIWLLGVSIFVAGVLFVLLYNKVTTGSFRRDRQL